MSIQRVFFHLGQPCIVRLPGLLNPDGTPYDLTGASAVSMITRRDNKSSRETTTIGVTAIVGQTPGTLSISDPRGGILSLTTDPFYFTSLIPVYGVIWVDGQDFPQDGYINLLGELV